MGQWIPGHLISLKAHLNYSLKGSGVLRESNYSHLAEKPQFWFNLKTFQVEVGPKINAENRVGPFDSEAEAKQALALIKERSQKWADEEANE